MPQDIRETALAMLAERYQTICERTPCLRELVSLERYQRVNLRYAVENLHRRTNL